MTFEPHWISFQTCSLPGAILMRYLGVFASNSKYRADIIKRPNDKIMSEKEVRTEEDDNELR